MWLKCSKIILRRKLSSFEVFDVGALLVMLLSCCCASGEISFIGLVKSFTLLLHGRQDWRGFCISVDYVETYQKEMAYHFVATDFCQYKV